MYFLLKPLKSNNKLIFINHKQASDPHEFFAEAFMQYVSQGVRVRNHINNLQGEVQYSWRIVYEIINAKLGGREYE